nr:hypothetical protein [Actinomadura litoris]
MAGGIRHDADARTVQYLNGFEPTRFLPALDPRSENHIGECIADRDGRIAYLKTFRLSDGQVKRGNPAQAARAVRLAARRLRRLAGRR